MKYMLRKMMQKEKLAKIFYERLTEPFHLNLLSVFVALFGSFEQKVEFDLIVRQQFAFCLNEAAVWARRIGLKSVTAIEFGTGSGMGLLNMCGIAKRVTMSTGVSFEIVGFDLGSGLPQPRDYRDHPEIFGTGSYPLLNKEKLLTILPDNARLILGDVAVTVPEFAKIISNQSPVGFVSVDVDYYSSARECLRVFEGDADKYLPFTLVYLDDAVDFINYSPWTGELLAVEEFNARNEYRKISPYAGLRGRRIFKRVNWIDKVFIMHALDHQWRSIKNPGEKVVEKNLYL